MKARREGGFLLAKIHQLGGRVFARQLKVHRVTALNPAQGRIMFVLWRRDGIPIRELVKETSLEKSTLTSMLDRLEASGLIRRVPSSQDRREILIHRTERDRAFHNQYLRVSQEMTKLFYDGFTEAEIDRFEESLQRIWRNLMTAETDLKSQ